MIMAQRVDGIIVVTFMAKSRKEHLRKVLQLAHGVNVRVFGIVLNGIPQGRAAGVYGYETYGYASDDRRFRQQKKKRRGGTAGRPAPKPAADPDDRDRALDLLEQQQDPTLEPVDGVTGDHSGPDAGLPDDIETAPRRPSGARSKG